ncbi:MAG: peptidoglycan DD-metalloendopeptidase family protein [Acidimicrobiales bacterium]|nr:peptidoglycan DD-metalloendopeptidase family protein [Acidimicrobiales bacterium]
MTDRSVRGARLRRAGVAAFVGVALAASPAWVRADSVGDARARREQVRQERAQAAARLDPLRSSDLELEAAIGQLDGLIAVQEAQVADARQAAGAAGREAEVVDARLAETEARVAELRAAAVDRAVQAYVFPVSDLVGDLATSADWNAVTRREALLDHVSGRQRGTLDELRAAEEDATWLRAAATEAAARAEERRALEEQRLVDLQASRDRQAQLRADLEVRIQELLAEIDELERSDAALALLIREAQAAARPAATGAAASPGGAVAPSGGRGTSAGPGGAVSSVGLQWPTSGPVTSEYGQRWGRLHAGIDIAPPAGTPIYAAAAGTVILSGWQDGYGNVIIIDHGGGISTLYGHQSERVAQQGQQVSRGQLIGYVGSTGRVTGPHLHFEVRAGGTAQNPRNYLP